MVNAILIKEVRNTMQTHSSKTRLVILTALSLVLEGCSISDWYNNVWKKEKLQRMELIN